MRATSHVIAELLPARTARDILTMTGGRELRTWTDDLHPVADPAVTKIAALLTTEAASQVAAVAARLGFDYSDVITEVANVVAWRARSPKRLADRDPRHDLQRDLPQTSSSARRLAASSFPRDSAWTVPERPQPSRDAPSVCDSRAPRAAHRLA